METEKVFDRKKELIKRDPLFDELTKTFYRIIDARSNEKGSRRDDPVIEDIERYYAIPSCPENVSDTHKKKYPDHWNLFQLEGKIGYKWHVHIKSDFSSKEISFSPYTNDEVMRIGSPPFEKYSTYNASIHYPKLKWSPYPNPFKKEPILADINEFITPGYKGPGKWIPILINVARLKNNDAKKVKRLVWKIVESELLRGESKKPHDEYPECSFLYSLRREDTFKKYLRWYDIHTEEKLSFRLIAHIDKISKTNPDKASEVLETLKSKRIRWGKPVKGEDAIEKGIKLIYKAIYRTDYSQKNVEPLLEKYNCPQHEYECTSSCKYYKSWMNRFNRLMPV